MDPHARLQHDANVAPTALRSVPLAGEGGSHESDHQFECGYVVRGETEDELVADAQKHARDVHGMAWHGDDPRTGAVAGNGRGGLRFHPFGHLSGRGRGAPHFSPSLNKPTVGSSARRGGLDGRPNLGAPPVGDGERSRDRRHHLGVRRGTPPLVRVRTVPRSVDAHCPDAVHCALIGIVRPRFVTRNWIIPVEPP
ncbi:DUF1059 domain-containing protein [Saccharothrix stipae]